MLDNYQKLDNGLIKQVEVTPIQYDFEYSNKYNKLGELSKRMSYLRFGYLIGALGFTPESIMDVGYGNGDFLNVAKDSVLNCYGSDIVKHHPVPEGCKFAESLYSVNVDVVCFFDSLEHFEDIYEIKDLQNKYVYISLPWCHYFSDEWFETWKHRRINEHLWHFNKEALVNFFKELGYQPIALSNIEDTIRKHEFSYENILTGIFKKQ